MSGGGGGDETGSIVVDMGSHTTKAGFGGEESPKAVFPTYVGAVDDSAADSGKGYYTGTTSLAYRRDGMEVVRPIQAGKYNDWTAVERVWDYIFRDALRVDAREHPVLYSEPAQPDRDTRERMLELMFETYEVPAAFTSKDAVLATYSAGRATATVLDIGHDSTRVVPVHDGFVLTKNTVTRTGLGGAHLNAQIEGWAAANDVVLHPHYACKKSADGEVQYLDFPNTTASYHSYRVREIFHDIKMTTIEVAPADAELGVDSTSYELPDGKMLNLGVDRFHIGNELFHPTNRFGGGESPMDAVSTSTGGSGAAAAAAAGAGAGAGGAEAAGGEGLHRMIRQAVWACDADLRKELLSGIVMTGGTSRLHGLKDRLQAELMPVIPSQYRYKVFNANTDLEQEFAVWIGGSILGSLGSFQQLWISRQEYAEHGKAVVHVQCP